MPNYIITTKANFKPFSYAELLAPVASATEAHRELEDAYSDLSSEASVWEKLANSEPDKDVYNVYKNYSNDLQAQADKLAKEGLTPTSRRDLLNMKSRYRSDIKPIEEAWTKREADIKEYKQLAKDPTLLSGDSNPMNASLTSYMNGNTPTYRYLSGEDLYKQGLTAATALSKGKYKESKPVLDAGRQYWKMVTEQGYSPDEAAQWLANNDAFPEITAEVNRIKEAYNTAGLGSNSAAADSQIIRGFMDGLHAGYTKDVDRQIYRSSNPKPNNNNIIYDELGNGYMKIGEKLYALNKDGSFKLDENNKPIIFNANPKPDKPSDDDSSLFPQMNENDESVFVYDTNTEKPIGHTLNAVLDPDKGKFKHIGTIAATVDNNMFDSDTLHDQLYLFEGSTKHELDHISKKEAKRTSNKIVDQNSGELKQYDYNNTGGFGDVILTPLSVEDLITRAETTEPVKIEKYANGNSYKVYKTSPLGKLLKKVATSTLAQSTKDGEEDYYHLNQKEWDNFIKSNLLFLEVPNNRNGLNNEGEAMSDILILQQQ